jgi:hypothetical protein
MVRAVGGLQEKAQVPINAEIAELVLVRGTSPICGLKAGITVAISCAKSTKSSRRFAEASGQLHRQRICQQRMCAAPWSLGNTMFHTRSRFRRPVSPLMVSRSRFGVSRTP